MEQKTKISAEPGRQDLTITREFDLPLELLFKAHVEPDIIEQWMGTRVLKFEGRSHGSYRFETTDPQGNKYGFSGTIHEFTPLKKITRTFEFEKMPFGVQLEVLEFEKRSDETSRIRMHSIYESVEQRDQVLKMPFAQGINMAHNRMEEVLKKLK